MAPWWCLELSGSRFVFYWLADPAAVEEEVRRRVAMAQQEGAEEMRRMQAALAEAQAALQRSEAERRGEWARSESGVARCAWGQAGCCLGCRGL